MHEGKSPLWDAGFARGSPMLEPFASLAGQLPRDRWPVPADLDALAASLPVRPATRSGHPIRFVTQPGHSLGDEPGFEARIHATGEVAVRAESWHDLFNALAWMAFPATKSALNARHASRRGIDVGRSGNRGPVGDALTLFDESGVVVLCSAPDLAAMLAGFEWKRLFWAERTRVSSSMHCFVVGHALHEKALRPFVGMTGRALVLPVAAGAMGLGPQELLEHADAAAAARIDDPRAFLSTRELAPLPVLGVPGWCADNASPAYYDNTDYFRPGRRRA